MEKHSKQPNKEGAEIRNFLEKIVIDAGIGRQSNLPNFSEKILPQIDRDLALMTGQKPQVRRAKKSIAGFKIREGQTVGLRVTLRKKKMVDFFERLITIVLPRVRDFAGIDARAIDPNGVLNVGLKEQVVFPEIRPEDSPAAFSIGMSFVPRRKDREASLAELKKLGFPFKKK